MFPRRSASFWMAWTGLGLFANRRTRPAGCVLLSMVGVGGVGAVYGRFCAEHEIPTEPWPAFLAWLDCPDRYDWFLGWVSHAVFAVPAIVEMRRWRYGL